MPRTGGVRAAAIALCVALACTAPAAAQDGYVPPDPPPAPPMLAGLQYLYGSAEAAALGRETWRALVDYVSDAMRAKGAKRRSVVLAAGASLQAPRFVPCDDKPAAAVFDVDETVLLNLGFEYDTLAADRTVYDDDVWKRWEQTGAKDVVPTPGAKEALDRLRAMGVTVIFNTNRNGFDVGQNEAALNGAGLGPAVHGKTLFLAGDDATGSLKDGRRQMIAARYCVLAMAGDQLGDLSDRFDLDSVSVPDRRSFAALPAIADLWGNGWFVMPNPAYGAGLQGGADDIFPKDRQWRDPGPAAAHAQAHAQGGH
jgi:predicted secreted acid phosphatase